MAILISINPPHTRNIFSGLKRVEWRHTALPKGPAYVYETKRGGGAGMVIGQMDIAGSLLFREGEALLPSLLAAGCVTLTELRKYRENNPNIAANYIRNAKLYDKPKELKEFTGLKKTKFGYAPYDITHAPQSWCHVEEV